jgi:hypothetical protein
MQINQFHYDIFYMSMWTFACTLIAFTCALFPFFFPGSSLIVPLYFHIFFPLSFFIDSIYEKKGGILVFKSSLFCLT